MSKAAIEPVARRSCHRHDEKVVCKGKQTQSERTTLEPVNNGSSEKGHATISMRVGSMHNHTYLRSSAEILNISRAEGREPSYP